MTILEGAPPTVVMSWLPTPSQNPWGFSGFNTKMLFFWDPGVAPF